MSRLKIRPSDLHTRVKWGPQQIPSWAIGIAVAALGWQVGFGHPATGIDSSWWAGLYMAAHDGLQFGTEIVFTYGPLGFLRHPWLFYPGALSLIPFLYTVALFVGFCIALVAMLRRRLPWLAAAVAALLVVVLLDWAEISVAISMFVALLLIERRPSTVAMSTLALASGVFAGTEMLIKLSTGPIVFLILLFGLAGARAEQRQIITYVISAVASTIVLWMVSGQPLGGLSDFVANSFQIMAGYNEAMGRYDHPGWYVAVVAITAAGALAWACVGNYPDRHARTTTVIISLLVVLALYKQAVVRIDRPHLAIFFATIALLWVALPPRRGLVPVSIGGLVVLVAVSIFAAGDLRTSRLNPIENVRSLVRESRTAFSPARQSEAIENDRTQLQSQYFLAPRLRDRLKGQRVSVDPWETTAAWAFEVEWSPVPVFQNYSAYTTKLDELNADRVTSSAGPTRIMRHVGEDPEHPMTGIDGRFLGWDPPAQAIATLCNFEEAGEAFVWQVLVRTENRCGPMISAGSVDAEFGQTVPVPKPGPNEVIVVRIEGAGIHGLERLKSLFFSPSERRALVAGGDYRLIPATAGDGLILRIGRNLPEGRGRFAQAPQSPTVVLTGSSGRLEYEFFRFRVRRAEVRGTNPLPADQPTLETAGQTVTSPAP